MAIQPLEPNESDIALLPSVQSTQTRIALPFDLASNLNFEELKLCVIPVVVEGERGKQVFDLLVDTGSEVTVITEALAKIVGVKLLEGVTHGKGIGSKVSLRRGSAKNIEIIRTEQINGKEVEGRISLGPSSVRIGELSGKFSKYSILGILGAETIQEICLKIDYPRKHLELSKVLVSDEGENANG